MSTNGDLRRGPREEREGGTWCVSKVQVGERIMCEYEGKYEEESARGERGRNAACE